MDNLKIGDMVINVSDKCLGLTVGKTYVLNEEDAYDTYGITIIDDDGDARYRPADGYKKAYLKRTPGPNYIPFHEGYDAYNGHTVEDTFEAPTEVTTKDTQIGGSHYKDMGIQPVEYIQANGLDYFEGNIVKYITRHKSKGGRKDIEKLIHYAQMILENTYAD